MPPYLKEVTNLYQTELGLQARRLPPAIRRHEWADLRCRVILTRIEIEMRLRARTAAGCAIRRCLRPRRRLPRGPRCRAHIRAPELLRCRELDRRRPRL